MKQAVNLQDKDKTMTTFKICLLMLFLLNTTVIIAQAAFKFLGNVKMSYLNTTATKNYLNNSQPNFVEAAWKMNDSSILKKPFFNSISPTYYTQHLGMMCKEELKLEKVIKFPVKFRLGSKEQVDYLEGKFYQH